MKLDEQALEAARQRVAAHVEQLQDTYGLVCASRVEPIVRDAIETYLAAREKQGWVEVPREPTEAMLNAMEEALMPMGEMTAAYDAMVNAAPSPPAPREEQTMKPTATEGMKRIQLRQRRAEVMVHGIMREIEPFLRDEPRILRDLYERLLSLFLAEGVEVLTDETRREAGLPPRGPDGWTAEELRALEQARLEALKRPLQPLFVPASPEQE